MEEHNKTQRKLRMNKTQRKLRVNKTQRKLRVRRASVRDVRDRLSDLPDCVLLHIMKFMNTKHAFQTCVLSKRWKDLCKCLPHLSFDRKFFKTIVNYNKFVCRILSSRYHETNSLLSLNVEAHGLTAPKFLSKIMKYVMLHDVPQLAIYIHLFSGIMPDFFSSFAFLCPSLTFLKLSLGSNFQHVLKFPESLMMPALKDLHLDNVSFTAGADDCAEPFSVFKFLNTLVLRDCCLPEGAKVLCISNANLSSLSLDNNFIKTYKIELSTPNLSSLSVKDHYIYHPLSSTDNLSLLEEVNIDLDCLVNCHVDKSWMQLFTNVKTLTVSSGTLEQVLRDLSTATRVQAPCFGTLKSLKVEMCPFSKLSMEEARRAVKYILQNTPTKVDISLGVFMYTLDTSYEFSRNSTMWEICLDFSWWDEKER